MSLALSEFGAEGRVESSLPWTQVPTAPLADEFGGNNLHFVRENVHRGKKVIIHLLISPPPSTAPALAGGPARRALIYDVTTPACPQATENERLSWEKPENFRDSDFRDYDKKKLLFLDVTLLKTGTDPH